SSTPPAYRALGHERLAACYDRLGDSEKSLDHYRQGRAIRFAAFGPTHPNSLISYLHLGRHPWLRQQAPDSCRQLLETAARLCDPEGPQGYLAPVIQNALAQHARYTGAPEEAIRRLRATLPGASPRGQAGTYINLGGIYKELGQWQNALACLEQARALTRKDPGFRYGAMLWSGIGLMQARLGRAEAAIRAHQTALNLTQAGTPLEPLDPTQNPDPEAFPATQEHLGHLERKAQSLLILYERVRPEPVWLDAASATYDQALDLIREMQQQSQSTRQILTAEYRSIFEGAIRCAWLRYQKAPSEREAARVLQLMAEGQAASLRKHLQESRAVIAGGIPDSLRRQLTRLDAEIGFLTERIHSHRLSGQAPDAAGLQYSQDRLFALKESRRALLAHLAEKHPRFFQ
ncbi:MAG: tetratricopeptide repeat protein, partial [Bacteroidetes bacterium]